MNSTPDEDEDSVDCPEDEEPSPESLSLSDAGEGELEEREEQEEQEGEEGVSGSTVGREEGERLPNRRSPYSLGEVKLPFLFSRKLTKHTYRFPLLRTFLPGLSHAPNF